MRTSMLETVLTNCHNFESYLGRVGHETRPEQKNLSTNYRIRIYLSKYSFKQKTIEIIFEYGFDKVYIKPKKNNRKVEELISLQAQSVKTVDIRAVHKKKASHCSDFQKSFVHLCLKLIYEMVELKLRLFSEETC